jgi:nicotinamidase-related amidase
MSDQAHALDPKRTALLVMDFQQGVLQRMPGLEPLLARVQGAIADMRDHGGTIGYVRVALSDGTEDPDEQARDVLLGRIFPRRAQVIDTATLRGLLSP